MKEYCIYYWTNCMEIGKWSAGTIKTSLGAESAKMQVIENLYRYDFVNSVCILQCFEL